jgi:hypothetical protein
MRTEMSDVNHNSVKWAAILLLTGSFIFWAGACYPPYKQWMTTEWSNLIFVTFMILSYFGVGCLGCAMKRTAIFPLWISWFCIIFGFSGAVLYLFGFPLFAPPLMVYLPFILTGIVIIIRLKSNPRTKS